MANDRGGIGNYGTVVSPRTGFQRRSFPREGVQPRSGTKPIYDPYELEETPGSDVRDVERTARLYSESLAFPNLAKDPYVASMARQAVDECLRDVYNVMEFLRNKWLILYRLYRGETLAQFQYGRHQLHSPEPFKAVETAHPRLMDALFSSEPWYRIEGEQQQDELGAKHQDALCRHQHRQMKWLTTASQLVRSFCIYGTAVQKTFWHQDVRQVRYRRAQNVPDPERPGTSRRRLREVARDEFIFDDNQCKQVSIFDFFAPPTASTIEDAEWCADRSLWSQADVIKMGELGHWENLHELADALGDNDILYGDEFKERRAYSYGVFDTREASKAPHVNHFTVVDWWGPLPVDERNGDKKDHLCNVVMIQPQGKRVIALVRKSPFWHGKKPYQVPRYISLEEELYGIGVIEMIARLSQEKDIKRNLMMAAMQLEGNPMLVVGAGANVPDAQLIARPGLVLRADDADAIKPLFLPKVSDALVQAENILTTDIRDTHGIQSGLMGTTGPRGSKPGSTGKTASQHTSEINEANMRLTDPIANFERELVSPMLEQMTWNNQQFMQRPKAIRVLGPEGLKFKDRYTVRPEGITGKFLYIPMASYRLSTQLVQNQQLINILDRAPVLNQAAGRPIVKVDKLLGKILREGFGFRDVAEFIALPQEELGLLSTVEEHENWYHGQVPPVREEDNHLRHFTSHMAEFDTEAFREFEEREPHVAAECRAHAADHGKLLSLMFEQQEQLAMMAEQQRVLAGGGNGGGRGFAGPQQDQESPTFRRERESGMPENDDGAAKSEGSQGAPNPGGS